MAQNAKSNEMLEGKKIIIIGGSSGIGLAAAKAVSSKNAISVIVSSNQERINNALQELPGTCKGYAIDVTNEAQLKNLFEKVGKFDHLVFTAGENLLLGNIADTSLEDARNYFNVRYWGAYLAVKYASPNVNPNGSVVLTSGIASNRPNKGWALGASICACNGRFYKSNGNGTSTNKGKYCFSGSCKNEFMV